MKLWPLTGNVRRHTRGRKAVAPVRPNPEAVAHLTAERARRRLARMSDRMPEIAAEHLGEVQRELGMVGYLVSEHAGDHRARALRPRGAGCLSSRARA